MVSLMVILFSTKCFLFVYMYINLLKLKAYKLYSVKKKKVHFLMLNISKNRSWYEFDCKCFSRVDKKHKLIFDIFFIYFLFHHLSFEKRKGAYSSLPSKDSLNYLLSLFKGWFHSWLFYKMLLVRLQLYRSIKTESL